MAEPVSTVDIEDVLASIRRLVLEEGEGAAAAALAPAAASRKAGAVVPLVLTLAQRVGPAAEAPAPPRPPPLLLVSPLQAAFVGDDADLSAPLAPEVPMDDPIGDDDEAAAGPSDEADDDGEERRLPVPSPDLAPAAPPPLDEGALRDLVAEVVRAELEGPLGERITHNVRKLVRREILAVLASRGL